MQLGFEQENTALVVRLSGELDDHSAQEIRTKLDDKIERDEVKNLILDFSDVSFMDSSGIGMVIGRYKKIASNGGTVSIVNPRTSIKKVFSLSGMDKIIAFHDDIEQALR